MTTFHLTASDIAGSGQMLTNFAQDRPFSSRSAALIGQQLSLHRHEEHKDIPLCRLRCLTHKLLACWAFGSQQAGVTAKVVRGVESKVDSPRLRPVRRPRQEQVRTRLTEAGCPLACVLLSLTAGDMLRAKGCAVQINLFSCLRLCQVADSLSRQ